MSYSYPTYTKGNNCFGPTKNNNFYFPHPQHNKNASKNKHKTRWILKENEQYEVFRISDENAWICKSNSALFSILNNGSEIFGENEERLAFFRVPNNTTTPWHGFPVFSSDYEISTILLDDWIKNKVITLAIRMKIERGSL